MIELIPINKDDIETLWKMQITAFSELLNKYQDYETNPAVESIDRIIKRYKQPCSTYYFINADGVKVGFIRIVDTKDGSSKRISPIGILPQYRNRDYAQAAIKEAERIYGETGWNLGTIITEAANCHLYEKMGYHRTGKTQLTNDKLTIVFYEK